MSRVINALRDAVLRRARPMSDGRMLVRRDNDFLIMDAGELLRHRWWRSAYIAILLGVIVVLLNHVFEFLTPRVDPVSSLVLFALVVQVLVLFADGWWARRLLRHRQPDSESDRFIEIWDGIR